jgi:hypothetical protein
MFEFMMISSVRLVGNFAPASDFGFANTPQALGATLRIEGREILREFLGSCDSWCHKKWCTIPVGDFISFLVASRAHGRWSMDFVNDALAGGRAFRVLTVVDRWSRWSPILEGDRFGHSELLFLDPES